MELQEIFDKVATHLFTQGVRSADTQSCLYRGPNGTRCAVGCLIPDEHYNPEMEGKRSPAIDLSFDDTLHQNRDGILIHLQFVHDNIYNWDSTEMMKRVLAREAERYDLDSSILETLSFSDK